MREAREGILTLVSGKAWSMAGFGSVYDLVYGLICGPVETIRFPSPTGGMVSIPDGLVKR